MPSNHENRRGWMWSIFTVRWVLGLMFLMSGWWRCFGEQMSPTTHARTLFIMPYGEGKTWIPDWLLWGLGVSIPVVELACGALVCLGLARRVAYTVIAAILVIVTYGHLLMEPLFDTTSHIFPRLVLLVFLWVAPPDHDVLSSDALIGQIAQSRRGNPPPAPRPPPHG